MSDITISKVKLVKGGEKLEISYQQKSEDGRTSLIDETCSNPVHPDLKKAVDALACHLAIQTDYLTEKRAMDKDELEKFVVHGYSVGGKEEEEGIVITGQRKGRYGHITLNTKFLKLDSDSKSYYLIEDLNNKIQAIESEVDKYIFEGKKAADSQLDMFAGQEENKTAEPVTNIKIDHPEKDYTSTTTESPVVQMADKPKKGGKKKVAQTADAPSGEVMEL